MASCEVTVRNIYGELKDYVDDNVGLLNKKLHRMQWKKRGKYINRKYESIRREKRWK